MSVFDELVGQPRAVEVLRAAARSARNNESLAHAWLVTGPPGSGRSVAARALAAALECTGEEPGCGQCQACRTVLSGSHPDVEMISTEGTTIAVDTVRELVSRAQAKPATGSWRVIIIEDADRMAERTTNVLLKSIEEPPPHTVWMLCTPSLHDVLPTIRSRCRHLGLVIPPAEAVADLLVRRNRIEPGLAETVARVSQSHIGRARGLAEEPTAREARTAILKEVTEIRGVGQAVHVADSLLAQATKAATALTEARDKDEMEALKRDLGIADESRIPPALRGQIKALEEEQKRRSRRSLRDGLDRAFVDLLSLYRDILIVQLDADVPLINVDFTDTITKLAGEASVETTIARMDEISLARQRINANVAPLLALEALLVTLRPGWQA